MIELTEAVQQMLERNTVQIVEEAAVQESALQVTGKDGSVSPWEIIWRTKA